MHITEISTACNGACTFIVLGVLNSRVGNLVDYVENDYFNPHVNLLPDDYNYNVPLLRSSRDIVINKYGRNLIDFCKESSLRILNGRIGEDAGIGDYTYVGHIGRSVVDYVLSSSDLIQHVEYVCICEPTILSDHCSLRFSLRYGFQ